MSDENIVEDKVDDASVVDQEAKVSEDQSPEVTEEVSTSEKTEGAEEHDDGHKTEDASDDDADEQFEPALEDKFKKRLEKRVKKEVKKIRQEIEEDKLAKDTDVSSAYFSEDKQYIDPRTGDILSNDDELYSEIKRQTDAANIVKYNIARDAKFREDENLRIKFAKQLLPIAQEDESTAKVIMDEVFTNTNTYFIAKQLAVDPEGVNMIVDLYKTDPDKFSRLVKLPPEKQTAEVGRLQVKYEAKRVPRKVSSKASPPPSNINGSSGSFEANTFEGVLERKKKERREKWEKRLRR